MYVCTYVWIVVCMYMPRAMLTSQMRRKSCCSTRSSSQVVFVTTVLSRGKSCSIDSPNVAPTPRLHKVTELCREKRREEWIKRGG